MGTSGYGLKYGIVPVMAGSHVEEGKSQILVLNGIRAL